MATIFEFKDKQHPQAGDAVHFQFANPGGAQHVGGQGFDAAAAGAARVSPHIVRPAGVGSSMGLGWPGVLHRLAAQQGIAPAGIEAPPFGHSALGSFIRAIFERPYTPPAAYQLPFQFTPDHGTPTRAVIPRTFDSQAFGAGKVEPSPYLRPRGLDATLWGNSGVINKSDLLQAVEPGGFVATGYGNANAGRALRFKFDNPAYVVQPGSAVAFDFVLQGGTQGIYAGLGDQSAFGVALLGSSVQSVKVDGIYSQAIGAVRVRYTNVLRAQGFVATGFGWPMLQSLRKYVFPVGFTASLYGTARIWNLRQHVSAAGFRSDLHGKPNVLGGVKYAAPAGIESLAFGQTLVINTTADQTARPPGIEPQLVPKPFVSPQTVFAAGFYSFTGGIALVQRNPSPLGWDGLLWGRPFVYQKTRYIRPAGIDGFETGYPRAADKARKLLHKASAVTAVFGDTRLRLKDYRIQPVGFDAAEPSPWAEVRNTRRFVRPLSVAPEGVGQGAQARNKTPSIAPSGFEAQQFGRLGYMVVGWRVRSVAPSGIPVPFFQFGGPSLWQTPSFTPFGIAAPAVPAPTVWPAVRRITAVGSDMQRVSAPTVWFSYRFIAAEGRGIAGGSYGTARVEHDRRGIDMLGATFMAFGTAWVSRGLRAVAPLGIPDPLLSLHQIGGTRYLGAVGFEATRWLTRITPENREIFPKTFGAEYGWPTVQNRKRPVFPAGIRTYLEEGQHWGTARVWNLRQVVTMYEDQESGLWPLPWPQWTAIENRNKVMRASGFNAGRVGGAVVANNARLVQPSGIDHPVLPEYQKTGAVTHRVRPLPLDGIEAPLMSRWIVVHNRARPLLPHGFAATLPGQAEVINLRRFYRMQGSYATEFGYPFVADRVRTLSFESRYGIQPPRIELPTVHLHTRYVEPPSISAPEVGNAALTIFFRRITPRWTHRDFFGDPFVKNKTPELHTRGRVSEEWGGATVRLQWRPILAMGASTQLFGQARVADRRQRVDVPGANFMVVSDKVTVRRFGEDPVATQYIDLRKFTMNADNAQVELDDGFGIPYPWPSMGTPDLLKGYIFHGKGPGQDHDMLTMGRPSVSANGVRVEPGIFDFYIGEPFVSLRKRRIDAPSIGQLIVDGSDNGGSMGSWGKPRLSPHTIYAVMEAPAQAMRNHNMNPTSLHPVHRSVTFGQARVTVWNGSIKPNGIAASGALGTPGTTWGVGSPSLINKRQHLAPTGTLMQRMGWPVIPGPQSIFIEEPIAQHTMGTPRVTPPPYVGPTYIRAGAISFQSFGQPLVDHRHRTVRPSGWFSQVVTASFGGSGGTGGYMPQTLTVGPRRPTIPSGYDAAGYGLPWVSLRVRELQAVGHDSFVSEYDYQNFAKRMRVRNASDSWGGRRSILTHGHQSSRVGAPGVRPGTHYIRPDGNSDQYRKGAF